VYVCVYARTHTHTAHGVLDVRSGFGTRHLEGPKNLDGLILGIFVFDMFPKYTYVYICWEAR